MIVADGEVNLLDAGMGTDTISYAGDSTEIVIDLSKQYTVTNGAFVGAAAVPGAGGNAQGDKLSGFENAVGGSGNDTITGTSANNVIEGGAGQ